MSTDSPKSPPRRRSRKPIAPGHDGHNLEHKLPTVDALLSHPATGHRSLRSVPASQRKEKLVDELLEMPEAARALNRVAESIRMNRQKRRASLAREFQALRERYSEHDLDKVARMVEADPGLLRYLQQRGELVELTLALVLSRRKHGRRWKPSQDEIVDLVDRVAEGTSSRNKAYPRVARILGPGTTESAVKQADIRARKKTGAIKPNR